MLLTEYKMFFDNKPATREQLDAVESITIEQAIDQAWEARIDIPVCTDDDGNWQGFNEDHMRGFGRVRVELRLGEGKFAPLIDGPIVGQDTKMDARPGESSVVLIVHDDSVYLNREDGGPRREYSSDSELAKTIFGEHSDVIAKKLIEAVAASPDSRQPEMSQRGTSMALLRELARRNEFHAYVLPGKKPGESVGVFAPTPTETGDLADLVLSGEERNLESFELRRNPQRGADVVASTISLSDKGVITRQSSFRDIELLGEEDARRDVPQLAKRRLPPGSGESVDLQNSVNAQSRRLSYEFEGSGSVRAGCYPDVLQPYRAITVRGIAGPHNGNYLISQVTHTLNRSQYTQSFQVKRNALSPETSDSPIPGPI